ncbi:MAG: Ig-like domain-containing protein, partial [Planctomycetota bacterium]
MLKGWKACALYCAAALLIPALSFADNTESLGTPSIPFVDGTKTVAAGAGLEGHTGVIDLQIDDPIRQVVVYWSGAMGANIPGDDTIEIEGVEIVGTPISDPTFFFNCSGCGDNSGPFYFQSFRADITDFGLVQLGSNQLEVATSFERENSGAGIIVTTDNGLRTGTVIGRDGMDIAFEDFGGARKNTVPQDYHFGPSLTERQAVLTLMVGSVGSELGLGSIVRVTIDGVSTDHVDLLSSADGNFWDTQEIPVTIPAGADVVTVQLISTGGTRPAGMTWVSSTLFVPNATESLATADIAIANGSNFVAAGTGLFEQPGTIELDVPAGQIRQVLAYWSGAELSAIPGDETIEINGVSVTGDLIGDPAFFFDCVGCGDNSGPFHYSSFRADITDLGLVTNGLNTLSIHSDFGTDNSGATIVVIYDDGTENRALLLKDGLDLAFGGFEGLRSKTAPQTFVFDASEAERTADLLLLVGSVSNGGGTNTVEVTVNGETTSLSGLLTSADGRLWDTLRVPVSVEAGVEALTVQLVSGGASPEPLSWVAAGLSIGVESDANVDAFASSVAASPSVISRYRGVSTITATLVDGEGAPLPGLEVLFLANGADLDGMVVDHGDGTYSQNVIAQETATFAEVFARAEGVTVAEPAVITLIGVDPALSTVTVAPEEVYLDGIAVVTVTPKDSNGVEVGIGEIVELSTDLGTLIGDVIDNGDGTYSQMIQANGIGTASISAVVGGIELDGAATL